MKFKGWVLVDCSCEFWIEGYKKQNGYFSVVTKIGECREIPVSY